MLEHLANAERVDDCAHRLMASSWSRLAACVRTTVKISSAVTSLRCPYRKGSCCETLACCSPMTWSAAIAPNKDNANARTNRHNIPPHQTLDRRRQQIAANPAKLKSSYCACVSARSSCTRQHQAAAGAADA
jgi:hypothetical protein